MTSTWSARLQLVLQALIELEAAQAVGAELDEHVGAFRDRSLSGARFPYVFLDATYVKAHEAFGCAARAAVGRAS